MAQSRDARDHDVQVYFSAAAELRWTSRRSSCAGRGRTSAARGPVCRVERAAGVEEERRRRPHRLWAGFNVAAPEAAAGGAIV
jgi:hypothetical protein